MRKKSNKTTKNNLALAGEKIYKATKKMQLPPGLLPNVPHIEMNGNREIVVEGSKGVLDYDENIVRIDIGKMIMIFSGRNLNLKCLTQDSLIVEGFVTTIEFAT
ncbi:MAG: YabP/YqfC family sporulation protein [Oscillospiraceae bacterium]|jgi:sporulation protein YqfC|nr:YabP/YqfC family sporulation protein [Oscillospiraceae bacterium]